MTEPVRVAVVGSGYFGRFHANHYSRNPRAKLVAVVDSDKERASAVAEEFGGEGVADHRSIVGRVDAVSVAVPTPLHFDIARDLIQAGIPHGRSPRCRSAAFPPERAAVALPSGKSASAMVVRPYR
jgi:predicted dehydrogenase